MKYKIKLGVVCLARTTFDYLAAKEIYDKTKQDLLKLQNTEFAFIDDLVIEIDDAKVAAKKLLGENIDGLVIISGTFHLGHLALILQNEFKNTPILLWAFNELPYNGGKIRLNSVCGVNLNASNLYKAGCNNYHCIVSDSISENWVDAVRIKSVLKNAHLGIAGFRAHGFFNLGIDELKTFKECGVLLDHYEIADLFSYKPTEAEISGEEAEVRKIFNCSGVTDEQVKKVSTLCASVKDFIEKNKLDGLAIRCWPEFAKDYGISPCATMSILQSRGYILGCEGDIEGVLSMIATRAVGAETPFLADLSQVNILENYAVMWHCGVAPCNLWDKKSVCSLDTYFAGGKGVTADFVMKTGAVNFVRFDSARGNTRIFLASGEAVYMEKLLKGTYAKVIFEQTIKELLETVTTTGVAHHLAMVYGEYRETFKLFAKMINWEVIC